MAQSVRFGEPADAERYLGATTPLPDGLQLVRGRGRGRAAARRGARRGRGGDTVRCRLPSPTELVPGRIATGSVVESVGGARPGARRAGLPGPVLSDVVVIDAPTASDSFGAVGTGVSWCWASPAASRRPCRLLAASDEQRVTRPRQG